MGCGIVTDKLKINKQSLTDSMLESNNKQHDTVFNKCREYKKYLTVFSVVQLTYLIGTLIPINETIELIRTIILNLFIPLNILYISKKSAAFDYL